MSITRTLSALGVVAASSALSLGIGATPAAASEPAPAAERVASAAGASFIPIRVPIIRCVPIFTDWDSDEVTWICEIVGFG